jgi:hypothetical protein
MGRHMSEMTEAQRRRTDSAMLDSLSDWFAARAKGWRGAHSFNNTDVAEMLMRASTLVKPRPVAVPDTSSQEKSE